MEKRSIYDGLKPIDLANVNTYELASRPSKVTTDDFARPPKEDDTVAAFLEKLPNILAASRACAPSPLRSNGRVR